MSRRLEQRIRDWLDAERARVDDLAEQALVSVFRELGRRAPEAGFADRVLLRAGRLVPAPSPWRWPAWLRSTVAASLVAAGLALALLPFLLPATASLLHAVGSPLLSAVSRSAARWMAGGFALWAVAGDVASAVRSALVTPAAVLVLTANVLLALASLLGLKRLLKAPEEYMPW